MENEHLSASDNLLENPNTNNLVERMETAANCSGSQVEDGPESEMAEAQVLQGNTPNDVFVYRQDVVCCSKYDGLLGVVMEVAGDSDSDGSITDDSDSENDGDANAGDAEEAGDGGRGGDNNNNADGDDEDDSLPDGQVRVVWTDGSETTDNITDITVVDRGFLHGDMVASATDPTGQLGLVVDVNIMVDLLAANGEVIKHVSSKDLKRIREFSVGDYVVRGPWLGRVDDVLDNVTVLFDDGSVCKVVKADPLRLQPVSKPVIDDAGCPYYPGQRIRAVSSSVFKSSRWLSGLWKANRLEGTVINVQTASVVVYWIASAHIGIDTNSSAAPSEEQIPKDLTLLDCFSYANWQLGDWCLLPSSSNAIGTPKSDNLKEPVEGSQVSLCLDFSNGLNTSTESSFKGPHDVDSVNRGDKLADNEATVNDSHDLPLDSGSVICNSGGSATSEESKNSMAIDMPIKGESNVAESNGSLLGDALCSITLSTSKDAAAHECWPSYRRKLRKVFFKRDKKARRRDETFERALFVVNTMTKVDVAWQDGTKSYGLESKSLIPIQTPNDHDFFPEMYVVEKASDEGDDSSEVKRIGIVRTLNAKDKTACVRWFRPVSRPEDPREIDCDELVSAYELDEHPDYDYCYGDVVVRLSTVPSTASTTNPNVDVGDRMSILAKSQDSREEHSDHDQAQQSAKHEACEDFTSLSWVGNITGLQDGDIEVTWADGLVSKVGPQAIYVVGRDDDGDSFGGGSEVSDDAASWETVDENDMNTLENMEKDDDIGSPTDSNPESSSEDNNLTRNGPGPFSMPLAALDYVTRLATGLFSLGKKQPDSESLVANGTVSEEILEASDKEAYTKELAGAFNTPNRLETEELSQLVEPEDAEVAARDDIDSSMPVERIAESTVDHPDGFNHFDIAENPLDHYYLGSSGKSEGGKKWVKKVQQEWTILEKNLPDAIFVRVFEDRMDLLRAVIIGAAGTPYQDGLFFFDFHLPPEFPQVPPSAYYHSGGLRVNPNLYVDGKVCLSLLNTWTGKGNEVWDSSSSSILQVLVSLQGLVLNAKPYFNEAGYDKQVGTIEGEKNSLPYNENTYLLNLKSMMYLLRRPPMHFESFVRDHFRRRAHYILKACEAYMAGCTMGSLTRDACTTEKSKEHPCSVGFKLMLTKILPRLISALTEAGADCSQFEHLRKPETLPKV